MLRKAAADATMADDLKVTDYEKQAFTLVDPEDCNIVGVDVQHGQNYNQAMGIGSRFFSISFTAAACPDGDSSGPSDRTGSAFLTHPYCMGDNHIKAVSISLTWVDVFTEKCVSW